MALVSFHRTRTLWRRFMSEPSVELLRVRRVCLDPSRAYVRKFPLPSRHGMFLLFTVPLRLTLWIRQFQVREPSKMGTNTRLQYAGWQRRYSGRDRRYAGWYRPNAG